MKTNLFEGEQLVKKGKANLHRGAEGVGGNLYLTNQRLIFEPHALNIQREDFGLSLSAVTAVDAGWTKLLGKFPVAPNAVIVQTGDGQHEFTVYGRKAWAAAIDDQARRAGASASGGA